MSDPSVASAFRYEDPRELDPYPREWRSLSAAFLSQARRDPAHPALADSMGASLTYRQAVVRSVGLARVLERQSRGRCRIWHSRCLVAFRST
jgi:hypothetical protein